IGQGLTEAAEHGSEPAALEELDLLAEQVLDRAGLGLHVDRVDAGAEGSREPDGQPARIEALPVVQGALVVVLVVGLQAAEEDLPFGIGGTQANETERLAGLVVLAALQLLKGLNDAVLIEPQVRWEGVPAPLVLQEGGVGNQSEVLLKLF